MSSISTRIFLYSWYAVLAIALIVESNVGLQWVSRNFCGDATVSAYHLEDWNSSSCLSWEAYWVLPNMGGPERRREGRHDVRTFCTPSSLSSGVCATQRADSMYGWVQWPPQEAIEDGVGVADDRVTPMHDLVNLMNGSDTNTTTTAPSNTTTSTTAAPSPRPTMPPLRRVYKLRWTANVLSGVMDRELNRFLHVFISLASPLASPGTSSRGDVADAQARRLRSVADAAPPTPPPPASRVFDVLVALEETSFDGFNANVGGGEGSSSDGDEASSSSSSSSASARNDTRYIYAYKASVTCWRTAARCTNIVLPASVVIPANHSRLTVTLIDVEAELAEATVRTATGASCGAEAGAVRLSGESVRHGVLRSTAAALTAASATSEATTGVGVMYQRAKFTLATMIFRYVSLLITLMSAVRFVYRSRSAPRLIFEQKWTLGLQLGLMLYLNPLYWWCIYAGAESHDARGSSSSSSGASMSSFRFSAHQQHSSTHRTLWYFTLYVVEFHFPTYFVALTVCYIWGVVGGSFRWSVASSPSLTSSSPAEAAATAAAASSSMPPQSPLAAPASAPPARVDAEVPVADAQEGSTPVTVPVTVTVSGSHLARRRVHLFLIVFTLTVVLLDTAKCFCEDGGPLGEWSDVTCRTPRCLLLQRLTLYVLLGGILSSGVGLYWLRRNLARHPYLSTRPQQLACRIMIFIYFTGGLYCVLQALILETLYAQLMAIIYYQPLVQLSHLLVLTSFVLHMTYVYTTTQSSLQIPLRPSDPRWKTVGWSSRWYRWLDWHGGSLYVFFNEAEERHFYEVQVAYQLGKRERKLQRAATRARRKAEEKKRPAESQRGRCPSAPPMATGGGDDNREEGSTAEKTDAAAAAGGAAPGCGVSGHRRGVTLPPRLRGNGASREDVTATDPSVPAGFTRDAAALSTAAAPSLQRAPLFTMSTNTLSALSEPEETDWLLMPDSATLPERRRTLSTVTQASSNTSEGLGEGHDCEEAGSEGGEGGQDSSQHTPCASMRVSWHTPSAASPFPPAAMPAAMPDVDNNADGGDGAPTAHASSLRQRSSTRMLSRVSSRVLVALHGAESRLVEGTATFVDLLAEKCVDLPLQVLLRQRARQRFVFFNLETAIDCLNLSREAYAVQESRGDDLIRTGFQVDAGEVPRAAVTLVERVVVAVFGLCFKSSPLEPEAVVGEVAVEGEHGAAAAVQVVDDGEGLMAATPPQPQSRKKKECEPLLQHHSDSSSSAATSPHRAPARAEGWRRRSGHKTDSEVDARIAQPPPPLTTEEGDERKQTSPTTPTRPAAPRASPSASPTSAASAAASPSPPLLLPHMNVEQYGYTPVAVFDTRGVQVVVARMDVSGACPMHAGKLPRLTIAFRGTDNVANVLEDIRFQKRTWKEMETPTLLPRASVHSGFLELWMSLKEAVIEVVLRELRGDQREVGEEAERDADETAAGDARGGGRSSGIFGSGVPFTSHWSAPAHQTMQSNRGSGFLRVYVTGHSLGGALACLCAYSLRRMLLLLAYPEPDIVVYTFGQPRIGNSVFKQHYNRAVPCTFRVVNESDAVSGFNILGGHHVGVQVNVDRHGNYVCKPMYIERLLRPTRGRGLALMNHKLAAYASSLNAIADVYAHGACPVRCLVPYMHDIESVSSTESEEDGEDACRLPQREEVEEAEKVRRSSQWKRK